MSDIRFELRTVANDPYDSLKTLDTKYVSYGIDSLDQALNGLESRTVTVITGRPSEGKSTFVHNVILNAVNTSKKVLLIDGEHNRNDLYNNLFRKVIGGDRTLYDEITCFKKVRKEPKPLVLEKLTKWFGNKLMMAFNYEMEVDGFDSMFSVMARYCKGSKIDLVVLDNLMSLVYSSQAEINSKQSDFMKRCVKLAKAENVAIMLVAHPNKGAPKGKEIDYYSISGTADIPNLMDNAIQIIKDPTDDDGGIICDGMAVVLKNRKYSEYPKIEMAFDKSTMGLCEIVNGQIKGKKYDWRQEGKQEWIQNDTIPF